MDRGDHGKRNVMGFSILLNILNGHNTSEELKHIYTSHTLKAPISNKAVDYHLRRLVKEGLIVKLRGRFYINHRSSKAIMRILFLMRDFPSDVVKFREGLYRMMDLWAAKTGFGIIDAIVSPDRIQDHFWNYTVEFMRVPRNLKDFFIVWSLPDFLSEERIKMKKEMEKRFWTQFDPKKHDFNAERVSELLYEEPEIVRKARRDMDKFMLDAIKQGGDAFKEKYMAGKRDSFPPVANKKLPDASHDSMDETLKNKTTEME
jgi:hypothetical protein